MYIYIYVYIYMYVCRYIYIFALLKSLPSELGTCKKAKAILWRVEVVEHQRIACVPRESSPLPAKKGQLCRFKDHLHQSQGQNMALTFLNVPSWLAREFIPISEEGTTLQI